MTKAELGFEARAGGLGAVPERTAALESGFVNAVVSGLSAREEKMAPLAAVLEFAERLIESEDGASCMDVLMMVGEIFRGWSLEEQERAVVAARFGAEDLSEAFDGFCRLHGSSADQVYIEWYYRVRIEDGVRNSYVFVGSDGGSLEYPGEFLGALDEGALDAGASGCSTLAHIDGVVVFGDSMSGIYG